MKKSGVFIIAILTSLSLSVAVSAKSKKVGLVKSFGNAVNNSVKSGVSKNVKGGIYGKSSLDQATDKPAPKTAPTAAPPVKEVSTGTPVDVGMVRKNQSKEEFLASGILYLNTNEYNKALDSFKKAQAISNDIIIQRWVDVANNKIKIKSVNSMLENVKP